MKTLFPFLFATICSFVCFGQVELTCSDNATFRQVIDVPDKLAAEIFSLVNRWVAVTYTNPDKATMARLENEMIRGKGFKSNGVKVAMAAFADMYYSWQVDIKDSKVRFTMSEMRTDQYAFETYVCKKDGTVRTSAQASNIHQSFEGMANSLASSLKKVLFNEGGNTNEDW
jgi:hypothetical protein